MQMKNGIICIPMFDSNRKPTTHLKYRQLKRLRMPHRLGLPVLVFL